MPWTIVPIGPWAEIGSFNCGQPSLNSFLKRHAVPNDISDFGRTFVATETGQPLVAGYVTLAAGAVKPEHFPDHGVRRMPRYPIPTIHVGRLAVDLRFQERGLGKLLLVHAIVLATTTSLTMGVNAIDLVALDERAKSFYLKFGFKEFLDDGMHLFMPIESARRLVQSMGI